MFDWLRFFNHHNIEYVEQGPNVKRGNVNIRCPYCGHDDPSHHMGVSLKGAGWGCWRNINHRGKSPTKLVMMLLGCSYQQAVSIVGEATFLPDDFMAQVTAQFEKTELADRSGLELPSEFKAFTGLPSSKPYVRYLLSDKRGFTEKQIALLTKRYGIRYCTRGSYKGRIIFPVYHKGDLVTWTGRTIFPSVELRYKTLSIEGEKAAYEGFDPAVAAISDYLLWYDDLLECDADTILLVEGPFDALKVDVLGRKHGIRATCFFTNAPSLAQVDLLHDLLPKFRHRYLLLDRGTTVLSLQVLPMLSGLGVKLLQLPPKVKDPGELTWEKLWKLVA